MSSDPMRVVLVGPARFGVQTPYAGGLESFVGTLAGELRRRGHDVELVAGVRPPRPQGDGRRNDLPADDAEAIRDGIALRDAVASVSDRSTLVHLNAPTVQVLDLVDDVRHLLMTLHTPPFPELSVLGGLWHRIGLTTPSRTNADRWFDQFGVVAAVVPNGIDRSVFRPRPRGAGYLAWAGRIVPEKGLHLAIDAARLVEMPLRIAGPAHDRTYFEEQIAPRLHGQVTYVGHLGPDGLAVLLGGATVTLVTPLWPEPFGLVVPESLACGTPVAALSSGALVGDGSGAFPPDVVATTTDRTATGLAEATLLAAASDRSRCRSASAKFDLTAMVDDYERRYRQALEAPAAA